MELKQQQSSISLKQRLKRIICCNFCDTEDEFDVQKVLEHSCSDDDEYNSSRHYSSSLVAWIKSEFPEFKEFCASLLSKKHRRNRRVNSSEFRYDPMSYALNFEDDDSHLDEFPIRNFSSRLPPSPVKEMHNDVVSTKLNSWS